MIARKHTAVAVLAILMLLTISGAAQSQTATGTQTSSDAVPHFVKFSGSIKDNDGKPRTGTFSISFTVYDKEDSPSPLWLETQNLSAIQFLLGQRHVLLLTHPLPSGPPPISCFPYHHLGGFQPPPPSSGSAS